MARADTAGVFQLEGTGMRESLRKLRPDRFEDIIAMVALYRPGPMDNIPVYIARKHGEEDVDYLHPMLEPVLKETYGVIIYQEQVQKIAQVMAGYTLGQADILRRAMGKKDKAEMAREKGRFVSGAVANGVKEADAIYIFELVDKFAGYGFNKSHAAAYALISYHTAYLKANYPVEFMAASMTLEMGNTDKLSVFVQEARRLKIDLLPPCVNASDIDFLAEDGNVRYSMAALKNIGKASVEHIVALRTEGGPFRDLADFARRMDPRYLNKRALETLAAAGAFDGLDERRSFVHANVENILALANRLLSDRDAGQNDLFGSAGEPPGLDARPVKRWLPMDRLEHEFDAVGFYLSGHPLDQYTSLLEKLGAVTWATFEAEGKSRTSTGLIAGIVTNCRERTSKSGNRFAFAEFSDASGQFEAVIFSEALAAARDLLVSGTPVLLRVEGDGDGDTVKLRAVSIESLDAAARGVQRGCRVLLAASASTECEATVVELRKQLKPGGRGEVRLIVPLSDEQGEVELSLPGRYELSHHEMSKIGQIDGVVSVQDL
jgi:DNA polymerase-3 subunit alpha